MYDGMVDTTGLIMWSDALPEREAYWIRTLQTLIPHGLNSAYGKPYYP